MLMNVHVVAPHHVYVTKHGYISALELYPQVQQNCFLSMI